MRDTDAILTIMPGSSVFKRTQVRFEEKFSFRSHAAAQGPEHSRDQGSLAGTLPDDLDLCGEWSTPGSGGCCERIGLAENIITVFCQQAGDGRAFRPSQDRTRAGDEQRTNLLSLNCPLPGWKHR